MRRTLEVIYYHEDYELVILRSSWDSKVKALQRRWSIQDWLGPIPTRHGAAAFFLCALPSVFRKNDIHHHLYAFMISTSTTLEIFSQSITPHSNQILCSIHEQSDFWTNISCFSFSLFPSFLFFFPFFFIIFPDFSHHFPLISMPTLSPIWHTEPSCSAPLLNKKKGWHHGMPTLGICSFLHAPFNFFHEIQRDSMEAKEVNQ